MLESPRYKFSNWAGNESCVSRSYYQPASEEEIMEVVSVNSSIRMVGTGHSWSAICLNNEALVNLDRYNKVIHFDKAERLIKVQAGMKLWQLNDYLDKNGFALANLGSISKQSVAGAISTATHGSGIDFSILGSQVYEFSLICANGDKLILNAEKDTELFNLTLVNLGCLGVLSEITLKVVPAFNLRDQTVVMGFDEVLQSLDEFIAGTDHFKLWWFPHTDKFVVYRYTRTDAPVNDSRLRQWVMDRLISVNVYRLLLRIGHVRRHWRKRINRFLVNSLQPLDRIEKSYKVFNVPEPPVHRETEWAFDIRHAKAILADYRKLIEQSSHHINFIQEIRFTKADDYALSPCYQRNTIWIGAYNADNFGWGELLGDFQQLAVKYEGRPHWGKEFTVGKEYLNSRYPRKADFEKLRLKLDPQGKFVNAYIAKLFEVG